MDAATNLSPGNYLFLVVPLTTPSIKLASSIKLTHCSAGEAERKFANSAFILRSQDFLPAGVAASVKDRF